MALPVASSGTASFAGAWRRTLLFEPHNAAAPHVQSDFLVYWLQSACGLFVDLRRPPAALDRGAASFKSFAGTGSATLVGERCHFTWTRELDFRPAGAPDVGDMIWLEPHLLQEDGILAAGDDYREIWQRMSADAHCLGARLHCDSDAGAHGVLVLAGSHVAFATQRARPASAAASEFFAVASASDFSFEPSPEVGAWLDEFFSVLACDGVIISSSQSALVGQPVAVAATRLGDWRAKAPSLSSEERLQLSAALGASLHLFR